MNLPASAPEPPAEDPPALTVDRITLRYGGVIANSDVSFTIAPGQTCGVIGPNGAGKTSLFDVVSGLRRPTSGRVLLMGEDVTSHSAVRRARAGLRRTYQRHQLFGRLTVMENLLAAVEWRGGGGGLLADLVASPTRRKLERRRREQAEEVLEMCSLTKLKDTYAGSLPVGLARMVELARAVVDKPRVLLLDEPTSGLDEIEAHRLAETVAKVSASHGTAVALVEHDIGFVMERCHRIVVLNLGKVIADGTPGEIRADKEVREAYLR
ncbi:ABC transporter ATP-binding protein [Streptomyces spiralis]|uniref:ABC transporter ATP-binding protein n=1 Tax=Streptomyces spiralis TaxID=66376 RepID=UPI00340E75EC